MIKLPPVPMFWWISMGIGENPSWNQLGPVRRSFLEGGFTFHWEGNTASMIVSHTDPSAMTMWMLVNGDMMAERKVIVRSWSHNSKGNKIETNYSYG